MNVRPIVDLTGDAHFSEVTFDDVFLADDALIGDEGAGWEQVTAELAFERSGPERLYSSVVLLDAWMAHLRRHGAQRREHRHARQLRHATRDLAQHVGGGHGASWRAAKVRSSKRRWSRTSARSSSRPFRRCSKPPSAPTRAQAPDAELYRTLAYLSQISPTFSLRGGTREILRGMIARGLGLR